MEAAIFVQYTDKEFRRRFKVTKERFSALVDLLDPLLLPDELGQRMACVSSGSHVSTTCKLAATLRWLAGSNFLDAVDLFGLGKSTVYFVIWDVIYALDSCLAKPWDPYDTRLLTDMAMRMYARSKETVEGCIGAIDGMAVKIKKPSKIDEDNTRNYMNRKGFYSINLQALADADKKIVWYSMDTQGSTHDSLAFRMCNLGQALQNKPLPTRFWIAGDEAYVCCNWLLTPYGVNSARKDRYKDNFNFYLSRCRINVECAFGILVQRFGILRRPMSCSLEHVTKVVAVCIHLHNFAIDDGIALHQPLARDCRKYDDMHPIRQDTVTIAERGLKTTPCGDVRAQVTTSLKVVGFMRPAHKKQRRGVRE